MALTSGFTLGKITVVVNIRRVGDAGAAKVQRQAVRGDILAEP